MISRKHNKKIKWYKSLQENEDQDNEIIQYSTLNVFFKNFFKYWESLKTVPVQNPNLKISDHT